MEHKSHNLTTTAAKRPGVKLTRHSKGWVAKIGGKVKWLAPLDKPQLALERYHQKMQAHRQAQDAPVVEVNNYATIGQLGQLFLDSKFAKVQSKELKPRTYHGYDQGIIKAVAFHGYETVALSIPANRWQAYRAQLADAHDIHTICRHVGAVRALSKWASENDYIDRPFRFGTEFRLPSQKAMRAAKAGAGDRTYSPEQVKKILKDAPTILMAMFLLSINGGVGNTDISELTDANLVDGRVEFSRAKTGVARIIPLWPETVEVIETARAVRPTPAKPEWADRVFLTERGYPYVRDNLDGEGNLTSTTDKISTLFWKGMKTLGIERTFYDGRRTFQTIGDEVGPPHVVRDIMGHAARGDDMSSRYRQNIPLKQIEAVVNHVRQRLHVAKCFASGSAKASKARALAKARRGAKAGKSPRRKAGTAR